MSNETIAAISTPLGVGGIGIVRLSGPDARTIAGRVFRPSGKKELIDATGYTGMLGRIHGSGGDVDEAIAFIYRAPKSYTGEDVVELSCHGGIWAVRQALRLCLDAGARMAGPGEFTKRAFLNGKLDLSQAEAVIDIITATGDAALKAALAAKDGALNSQINSFVSELTANAAHLAAWMDYPEEDLIPVDAPALATELSVTLDKMKRLLATWDSGRIVREGITTAIVGRPNVGKSTLMNLLMGEQKSIVTDLPGTTRDVVEGQIHLGDYTLLLADTAGIRHTENPIESIGVDLSRRQIEVAGLILAVFDSSESLTPEDMELMGLLKGKKCVAVINKSDLPPLLDDKAIKSAIPATVSISAAGGTGKEDLERSVIHVLGLERFDPTAAVISNERQRSCLEKACDQLEEAIQALQNSVTLDAVGVLIESALDELLRLTGRQVNTAVVDAVFSQFCVGK